MKQSDLHKLAAEFPKEDVHWRAQTVTKDGKKALALAYIDARDVMDRLDQVCAPAGWQTRHRDAGNGKLGCEIGIFIEGAAHGLAGDGVPIGEWIWKSDGAGATDVEGDKGAFSDSLKRAAVSWGVGRYLYDLESVWVPCKSYESNGKFRFDSFTADPWHHVKNTGKAVWHGPLGKMELKDEMKRLASRMNPDSLITTGDLEAIQDEYSKVIDQARRDLPDWFRGYDKSRNQLVATLQVGPRSANPDSPETYTDAAE